jgi:CheY-like chemotaxis protein
MNSSAPKSNGGGSILLVEDNKHGLIARKALLEEQGFRVGTARNGAEAVELFHKLSFDLVVTDYKMPKMGGVELIRHIKGCAPAMPVILLSGFVDILGLTEQSTGADVVIAKNPQEVSNLLRSVKRLLRRRVPRKPPGSQRNTVALSRKAQ